MKERRKERIFKDDKRKGGNEGRERERDKWKRQREREKER